MNELINLLKTNARLTNSELAVMLNKTEAEVAAIISELERDGIIKGYTTIFDEDRISKTSVAAYV